MQTSSGTKRPAPGAGTEKAGQTPPLSEWEALYQEYLTSELEIAAVLHGSPFLAGTGSGQGGLRDDGSKPGGRDAGQAWGSLAEEEEAEDLSTITGYSRQQSSVIHDDIASQHSNQRAASGWGGSQPQHPAVVAGAAASAPWSPGSTAMQHHTRTRAQQGSPNRSSAASVALWPLDRVPAQPALPQTAAPLSRRGAGSTSSDSYAAQHNARACGLMLPPPPLHRPGSPAGLRHYLPGSSAVSAYQEPLQARPAQHPSQQIAAAATAAAGPSWTAPASPWLGGAQATTSQMGSPGMLSPRTSVGGTEPWPEPWSPTAGAARGAYHYGLPAAAAAAATWGQYSEDSMPFFAAVPVRLQEHPLGKDEAFELLHKGGSPGRVRLFGPTAAAPSPWSAPKVAGKAVTEGGGGAKSPGRSNGTWHLNHLYDEPRVYSNKAAMAAAAASAAAAAAVPGVGAPRAAGAHPGPAQGVSQLRRSGGGLSSRAAAPQAAAAQPSSKTKPPVVARLTSKVQPMLAEEVTDGLRFIEGPGNRADLFFSPQAYRQFAQADDPGISASRQPPGTTTESGPHGAVAQGIAGDIISQPDQSGLHAGHAPAGTSAPRQHVTASQLSKRGARVGAAGAAGGKQQAQPQGGIPLARHAPWPVSAPPKRSRSPGAAPAAGAAQVRGRAKERPAACRTLYTQAAWEEQAAEEARAEEALLHQQLHLPPPPQQGTLLGRIRQQPLKKGVAPGAPALARRSGSPGQPAATHAPSVPASMQRGTRGAAPPAVPALAAMPAPAPAQEEEEDGAGAEQLLATIEAIRRSTAGGSSAGSSLGSSAGAVGAGASAGLAAAAPAAVPRGALLDPHTLGLRAGLASGSAAPGTKPMPLDLLALSQQLAHMDNNGLEAIRSYASGFIDGRCKSHPEEFAQVRPQVVKDAVMQMVTAALAAKRSSAALQALMSSPPASSSAAAAAPTLADRTPPKTPTPAITVPHLIPTAAAAVSPAASGVSATAGTEETSSPVMLPLPEDFSMETPSPDRYQEHVPPTGQHAQPHAPPGLALGPLGSLGRSPSSSVASPAQEEASFAIHTDSMSSSPQRSPSNSITGFTTPSAGGSHGPSPLQQMSFPRTAAPAEDITLVPAPPRSPVTLRAGGGQHAAAMPTAPVMQPYDTQLVMEATAAMQDADEQDAEVEAFRGLLGSASSFGQQPLSRTRSGQSTSPVRRRSDAAGTASFAEGVPPAAAAAEGSLSDKLHRLLVGEGASEGLAAAAGAPLESKSSYSSMAELVLQHVSTGGQALEDAVALPLDVASNSTAAALAAPVASDAVTGGLGAKPQAATRIPSAPQQVVEVAPSSPSKRSDESVQALPLAPVARTVSMSSSGSHSRIAALSAAAEAVMGTVEPLPLPVRSSSSSSLPGSRPLQAPGSPTAAAASAAAPAPPAAEQVAQPAAMMPHVHAAGIEAGSAPRSPVHSRTPSAAVSEGRRSPPHAAGEAGEAAVGRALSGDAELEAAVMRVMSRRWTEEEQAAGAVQQEAEEAQVPASAAAALAVAEPHPEAAEAEAPASTAGGATPPAAALQQQLLPEAAHEEEEKEQQQLPYQPGQAQPEPGSWASTNSSAAAVEEPEPALPAGGLRSGSSSMRRGHVDELLEEKAAAEASVELQQQQEGLGSRSESLSRQQQASEQEPDVVEAPELSSRPESQERVGGLTEQQAAEAEAEFMSAVGAALEPQVAAVAVLPAGSGPASGSGSGPLSGQPAAEAGAAVMPRASSYAERSGPGSRGSSAASQAVPEPQSTPGLEAAPPVPQAEAAVTAPVAAPAAAAAVVQEQQELQLQGASLLEELPPVDESSHADWLQAAMQAVIRQSSMRSRASSRAAGSEISRSASVESLATSVASATAASTVATATTAPHAAAVVDAPGLAAAAAAAGTAAAAAASSAAPAKPTAAYKPEPTAASKGLAAGGPQEPVSAQAPGSLKPPLAQVRRSLDRAAPKAGTANSKASPAAAGDKLTSQAEGAQQGVLASQAAPAAVVAAEATGEVEAPASSAGQAAEPPSSAASASDKAPEGDATDAATAGAAAGSAGASGSNARSPSPRSRGAARELRAVEPVLAEIRAIKASIPPRAVALCAKALAAAGGAAGGLPECLNSEEQAALNTSKLRRLSALLTQLSDFAGGLEAKHGTSYTVATKLRVLHRDLAKWAAPVLGLLGLGTGSSPGAGSESIPVPERRVSIDASQGLGLQGQQAGAGATSSAAAAAAQQEAGSGAAAGAAPSAARFQESPSASPRASVSSNGSAGGGAFSFPVVATSGASSPAAPASPAATTDTGVPPPTAATPAAGSAGADTSVPAVKVLEPVLPEPAPPATQQDASGAAGAGGSLVDMAAQMNQRTLMAQQAAAMAVVSTRMAAATVTSLAGSSGSGSAGASAAQKGSAVGGTGAVPAAVAKQQQAMAPQQALPQQPQQLQATVEISPGPSMQAPMMPAPQQLQQQQQLGMGMGMGFSTPMGGLGQGMGMGAGQPGMGMGMGGLGMGMGGMPGMQPSMGGPMMGGGGGMMMQPMGATGTPGMSMGLGMGMYGGMGMPMPFIAGGGMSQVLTGSGMGGMMPGMPQQQQQMMGAMGPGTGKVGSPGAGTVPMAMPGAVSTQAVAPSAGSISAASGGGGAEPPASPMSKSKGTFKDRLGGLFGSGKK